MKSHSILIYLLGMLVITEAHGFGVPSIWIQPADLAPAQDLAPPPELPREPVVGPDRHGRDRRVPLERVPAPVGEPLTRRQPLHHGHGRTPGQGRPQADRLGDLDTESRRLLDGAGSPEDAGRRSVDPNRLTTDLRPGTMLAREWNGRIQRVAVLADGCAWNGKTYPSLSKIAQAITGTRWNGPRFFGLRDKPSKEARS